MRDNVNVLPEHELEDMRTDLMAALAASRDLGPEMDKALVDSYLQRHRSSARRQGPGTPVDLNQFTPFALLAFAIVAFIALAIVSQGRLWWTFWWLFWLLPVFGRWRWRYRDQRDAGEGEA
jgi:Flp pilus assembly protein TadB